MMLQTQQPTNPMTNTDWQMLYDCLSHGDDEHRAWLRGMIAGFATRHTGKPVKIE